MRLRIVSVGVPATGDGSVRVGTPPPDSNRPVDVLDIDLAAVLEANVDPIADALIDDRGDADAPRALRPVQGVRQY